MVKEAIHERVSIVVPTHRRPRQLRQLLRSLDDQLYPSELLELVVVPTEGDEAFEVMREYCKVGRIRAIYEECHGDPLRGRSASAKRNYGVSLASSPWIAFIDDDCVADRSWIHGASQFFREPTVGGIEGKKTIPLPEKPTATYKGLLSFTRPGGYQTCNMFYRRDVFLEVNGFDLRFPFYFEDTDLAWTVLDAGYEIRYAPDAVVQH